MMPRVDGGAGGDVDGEGDTVAKGGVDDAPGVVAAHGADGEGAAGDAVVVAAAGDALTERVLQGVLWLTVPTVRVLQVMVLGVGPRVGGRRWFCARALATPGDGPSGRCWSVCSPDLAVLVASGDGQLMERVVLVMMLLMPMERGRCRTCTE